MTTLIAGNFQQQTEAQQAMHDLQSAGFAVDQTTTFYVSSAGQHDIYPIGGDEDKSPGMEGAEAGVIPGVAVGGAIAVAVGMVTAPLLGPGAAIAGAGVGAYVGSLYGALGSIDDKSDSKTAGAVTESLHDDLQRQSGMLVAVCAPASAQQGTAVRIMRKCGATSIDSVEGTLVGGEWIDFNPLTPMYRVIEQC